MLSEKSFTITVVHTDDGYKSKVISLDHIDTGKENPIRTIKEKEYTNDSIEAMQKDIEKDFGVTFVDLFEWYWTI
jgi:hypothetical protein